MFTALHWHTDIAEKLNVVPCFQNQACLKLNKSLLLLEHNAQKLYNYILSHIFTFSIGKKDPLPMHPESP